MIRLRLRKVHKIGMSEFRKEVTNIHYVLSDDEAVCVTVNGEEKLAVINWEVFQEYADIIKTIQDPYRHLEFNKFMRDMDKPKAFTDILRSFYDDLGYIDKYDKFDEEGKEE